MATTLFSNIIAEYKTQKAALTYSGRIVQTTKVIKSTHSHYDPFWPSSKPCYQVVLCD